RASPLSSRSGRRSSAVASPLLHEYPRNMWVDRDKSAGHGEGGGALQVHATGLASGTQLHVDEVLAVLLALGNDPALVGEHVADLELAPCDSHAHRSDAGLLVSIVVLRDSAISSPAASRNSVTTSTKLIEPPRRPSFS